MEESAREFEMFEKYRSPPTASMPLPHPPNRDSLGSDHRVDLFPAPKETKKPTAVGMTSNGATRRQATLFESFGIANHRTSDGSNPNGGITASRNAILEDEAADLSLLVKHTHRMDREALKSWLYPTNCPVRDYQFSMIQASLFQNTLVALPTGLGKTFIAAVIMFNFYRWFPDSKIVFMAPTKPLVAQQIEACYKITGIPQHVTDEMTGQVAAEFRKRSWNSKRVFFLTPQVMQNDLAKDTCPADKIALVVIDEAHKALGKHAYCENAIFRVLALTATPGSDVKTVQNVVENLQISKIEIRTEDSLDIKPYTHERSLEVLVLPPSEDMVVVSDLYRKMIEPVLNRLVNVRAFYERDPRNVTRYTLMQAREKYRSSKPPGASDIQNGMVEADFALGIALCENYNHLHLLGIRMFLSQIEDFVAQSAGSKSRSRANLIQHPDFQKLLSTTRNIVNKPGFVSHPKVTKLVEAVVGHFQRCEEMKKSTGRNDLDTRAMVFSNFRESVEEIRDALSEHAPLIRVMSFVGQGTGKRGKGCAQKEQLQLIQTFRSGQHNVLVATSIGEEGLDIGDVDLIVCYDVQNSPIRMLQRMGRTGRKREGRVVLLLSEGKEEDSHRRSQTQYKTVQKAIIEGQGTKLKMFSGRDKQLLPPGIRPVCVKENLEIPEYDIKKKSVGGKLKNSKGKPDAEQSNGPYLNDNQQHEYEMRVKLKDKPYLDFCPSLNNALLWQTISLPVYRVPNGALSTNLVNIMQLTELLSIHEEQAVDDEWNKKMAIIVESNGKPLDDVKKQSIPWRSEAGDTVKAIFKSRSFVHQSEVRHEEDGNIQTQSPRKRQRIQGGQNDNDFSCEVVEAMFPEPVPTADSAIINEDDFLVKDGETNNSRIDQPNSEVSNSQSSDIRREIFSPIHDWEEDRILATPMPGTPAMNPVDESESDVRVATREPLSIVVVPNSPLQLSSQEKASSPPSSIAPQNVMLQSEFCFAKGPNPKPSDFTDWPPIEFILESHRPSDTYEDFEDEFDDAILMDNIAAIDNAIGENILVFDSNGCDGPKISTSTPKSQLFSKPYLSAMKTSAISQSTTFSSPIVKRKQGKAVILSSPRSNQKVFVPNPQRNSSDGNSDDETKVFTKLRRKPESSTNPLSRALSDMFDEDVEAEDSSNDTDGEVDDDRENLKNPTPIAIKRARQRLQKRPRAPPKIRHDPSLTGNIPHPRFEKAKKIARPRHLVADSDMEQYVEVEAELSEADSGSGDEIVDGNIDCDLDGFVVGDEDVSFDLSTSQNLPAESPGISLYHKSFLSPRGGISSENHALDRMLHRYREIENTRHLRPREEWEGFPTQQDAGANAVEYYDDDELADFVVDDDFIEYEQPKRPKKTVRPQQTPIQTLKKDAAADQTPITSFLNGLPSSNIKSSFAVSGPSPIVKVSDLTKEEKKILFVDDGPDNKVEKLQNAVGDDRLCILVDNREVRSGIPVILKNRLKCRVEFRQLAAGDYVLSNRVAIERKSKSDLLSSTFSKRIFEQIDILQRMYVNAYLLVERDDSGAESM
ncbi:hypothetical protein HDU83_008768 [Entophlyctis luteolus]|nr:hypothetical protein HDU83_008768 [Entophlyctis luteolus]